MNYNEALEKAKKELDRVSYYLECRNLNSGMTKIYENRYDFLRAVVSALQIVI